MGRRQPASRRAGGTRRTLGRARRVATFEGKARDVDRSPSILDAVRGAKRPPEIAAGSGRGGRRFVVALLLTAFVVVAVIGLFNGVIDPLGTLGTRLFPTVIESDQGVKVQLADRLPVAPQLIILGSSRAMKAQPSFLQARTGLPGFNAAVSNGKPWDSWAFANFLHDRFPQTRQRYLWFVDIESFRPTPIDSSLLNVPALSQYLSGGLRQKARLTGLPWLFSWQTALDSWRVLHAELSGAVARQQQASAAAAASVRGTTAFAGSVYTADGFRLIDYHDRARAHGLTLAKALPGSIAEYVRIYGGYRHLDPLATSFFQRTLQRMNSWGATPVIVLTPYQPRLLAALKGAGWDARHRQVLAYLRALQAHYRFVVLDMTTVESFGGSPGGFYDGVHMLVPNMHRLLDAVLARSGNALR
jgi:hypothetical protein